MHSNFQLIRSGKNGKWARNRIPVHLSGSYDDCYTVPYYTMIPWYEGRSKVQA